MVPINYGIFFLLFNVACAKVAEEESPLTATPAKATKAWELLKESMQDNAPLLSAIRSEERKAKSKPNLRASKKHTSNATEASQTYIEELDEFTAASDRNDAVEAAAEARADEADETAEADADAMEAALNGKEDVRPVDNEAAKFEHSVTDLILGLGKAGMGATPMGDSVSQMKKMINEVMLGKVQEAHDSNQKGLNDLAAGADKCGSQKDSQLTFAQKKEKTYKEKSPVHKTCRAAEAQAATEMNNCNAGLDHAKTMSKLTCKTFDNVKKSVASQVVNSILIKKAGSEASESYVKRLTASVCGSGCGGAGGSGKGGYLDKFTKARDDCDTKEKAYKAKVKQCAGLKRGYNAKKMECDAMQAQMDNAACNWAVQTKDACENYASCFNSKKNGI